MHTRLRGSKSLFTVCQIINKPDFPSLADEIAEPHPDMNIKFAAFTVSEKSSTNLLCLVLMYLAHYAMGWPVIYDYGSHWPYLLGF